MRYYGVDLTSDPKVIGVKNGLYQAEISKENFKNYQEYERTMNFFLHSNYWKHENVVPDFDIELKKVRLLKKAMITDFMGYSQYLVGIPFLISKRVADIFEHFKIQQNYLYRVELYTYQGKEVEMPYYLFYCPFLGFDTIDYKNSVLYSGDELLGDKQYHTIHSLEEYNDLLDETPFIHFEKLTIVPEKELNLYQLRTGGIFVSNALREAMDLEGLTGITYKEHPLLVVA